MKITKNQLRQLIKEEIMKEINQISDIDMEDLALVYDEEYGPDYVAGIMADEFPSLDNDAKFEKLLGMLKEAARRGEEDYPLNFLANRIAELANK
jgi:predicted transcriptional regulator